MFLCFNSQINLLMEVRFIASLLNDCLWIQSLALKVVEASIVIFCLVSLGDSCNINYVFYQAFTIQSAGGVSWTAPFSKRVTARNLAFLLEIIPSISFIFDIIYIFVFHK